MLLDPVRLSRLARGSARVGIQAGKLPARAAWRRWVLSRGTDDTAATTTRRCVVVAPHPDDETIGCGATIARKRAAGTETWVVVVTDGRHSHRSEKIRPLQLAALRQEESRRACELLGVDPDCMRFLGFEEGTMDRCLDDVADAIGAVIDLVRPDEVLVSSENDWNLDHRATHAATCRALAARSFGGRVGAYPVWFWADGPWRNAPWEGLGPQLRSLASDPAHAIQLPAPWLVSTAGFVDLKRAAYGRYLSQVTNLTGEPSWQVFPERWSRPFLGDSELFFPVDLAAAAAGGADDDGGPDRTDPAPAGVLTTLLDDFEDDRLAGRVLGTAARSGAERRGVDVEGTLGIDNRELRLATLATPGFGRQTLTYGPFERRPGLTLAVQVLNSHNTAQSNILGEGRRDMLKRIARELPAHQLSLPFVDDNLAVGFWPEPAPADPRTAGNAFVMHAASTVNGELRARAGEGLARLCKGVQELPITYVVCLRERGAAYFVSSVPGATGMAAFPAMRPVAIDHARDDGTVFAGLSQAVHGEVGHDIATRVSLIRAEVLTDLDRFSLVADPLRGSGPLTGEVPWQVIEGTLVRHDDGMSSGGSSDVAGESPHGAATVELAEPAGLVHLVVDTAPVFAPDGQVGLIWRAGPDGAWRVIVSADRAELGVGSGPSGADGWVVLDEAPARLEAAGSFSLQVLDDGSQFSVHLDGALLFDRWFDDDRLADQRGVGLLVGPRGRVAVHDFEALPRQLPVPDEFGLVQPWCEQGSREAFADEFSGPAGELAGPWERSLGDGHFALSGDGTARVVAELDRPNAGRTIYSRAWHDPSYADIEVELTPPGDRRDEGHRGRGGLAFFEDADTHLIVNTWLDDAPHHDGSSISMFFRSHGYERLFDACWTNVGRKVFWGRPFRLRLAFDGDQIMTWLNDEPILYRRMRDIYPTAPRVRINRVGLVANWEWGDDTGTTFRHFTARSR